MRSRRVEFSWGELLLVWFSVGIILVGAGLWFNAAYGVSSIDTTQPVASSDPESTPIRGNFTTAANEISALQSKFPSSSSPQYIPVFADSVGGIKDPTTCSIVTTGSLAPNMTCLGRIVAGRGLANNTGNSTMIADVFGGTSNIFEIANVTPLWWWDSSGNLISDLTGASEFLVSQNAQVTINAETVVAGAAFTLTSEPTFGALIVNISDGDGSVFTINASGQAVVAADAGPALSVTNTTDAIVAKEVATTTGDDPTCFRAKYRTTTTNATQTTIATIATTTDTVMQVEANIIARVTGGSGGNAGAGASYKIIESVKNVSGTVTTLEGSAATAIETSESAALSAYAVTIDPNSTNAIVTVKGQANDDVTWHAHVTYCSVGS